MDKIKSYFQEIFSDVPTWWLLFVIFCVEILSYCGSVFPLLNQSVFAIIFLATFFIALWRLRFGVGILFVELVIGSKGYLFSLPIGEFTLSIRLALFSAVFVATLIVIVREKRIAFFAFRFWKHYTALVAVILFAAVVGIIRHHPISNVFYDMNGFLYLGLLIPMTQSLRSQKELRHILGLLIVASSALIIKTVILLGLFSQFNLLPYTLPGIYRWVRDTGVGEITRFPNGFSRIFFQSHIFMVLFFFFCATWLAHADSVRAVLRDRTLRMITFFFAACMLVIFLSYSRSFWMAVFAVLPLVFVWLWRKERFTLKRIFVFMAFLIIISAIDYGIAFGIVNLPLEGHRSVSAQSLVTDRATGFTEEAAAVSRWKLLQPLSRAAVQHPLIGSGFGTTVTYQSDDPRNKAQKNYTTFSFEWGYLDLLLKTGIIGVVLYGALFWAIAKRGLQKMRGTGESRIETLAVLASLSALLAVHVFTPYLNHPLGLGWILLASLLIASDS